MVLKPEVAGAVPIKSSPERFFRAFRDRVDAGLLTGRPHPRSRYAVVGAGPDSLQVSATDWWTAINVGLNSLELEREPTGFIHYRIRYWRWATYVLGLSAALGVIGIALLLSLDVRGYIASHPASRFPGLSIDQAVLVSWLMVLFWGFIWPWLLIALHKRPLHRLITRLIEEVDGRGLQS